MGILNQLANSEKNKSNPKAQAVQFYNENKRLVNSLAWASALMLVMKGTAVYLQAKDQQ
eukprot:403336873